MLIADRAWGVSIAKDREVGLEVGLGPASSLAPRATPALPINMDRSTWVRVLVELGNGLV